MITYGTIVIISIGSAVVESRCRIAGNINGALASRRFGRSFLFIAGGMIAAEWIRAMIGLF